MRQAIYTPRVLLLRLKPREAARSLSSLDFYPTDPVAVSLAAQLLRFNHGQYLDSLP